MDGTGTSSRRRRPIVVLGIAVWGLIIVVVAWWAIGVLGEFVPSARSTPRYDPPVMAGQMVTGACSGGFYARDDQTIVITISAHCQEPGVTLRDGGGRMLGILGPRAQLAECPEGRFCAPSDFLTLAVAADLVPWGHLNLVDMGAGGYRTIEPDTRALACSDVGVGARVELDGRERYRSGTVLEIGPYAHATDTIVPCMIVADIEVGVGDSGAAVLVDGLPAGIVARELGDAVGITPLAEGLENLGLTLCTTPDCDLSPATADQPSE